MRPRQETPTDSDFILPDEIGFDNELRFGAEINSGSGGWSRKFKAARAGRHIFVKALKAEYAASPLHRALLRKEFEIGFGLSHPNVAQTLSHEHNDELGDIITCEFVDGPTLKEYLESRPFAPSVDRHRILAEICDAVEYIHSQGLVHRDLKPSNIMLTARRHTVKLIDFGAADGDVWSAVKAPAGTPGYAAPEQYTAEGMTDSRSDIYAIGLIIRELLPDDKAALAVASRCTDRIPERRPQDAGTIPALISQRRRAWRTQIAAAAAGCALIVAGIVWLSVRGGVNYDKAADAVAIADSVSHSAQTDAVMPIADSKVVPIDAPSSAHSATDYAASLQLVRSDGSAVIPQGPANDSLTDVEHHSGAGLSGVAAYNPAASVGDSLMALLREKTHQISFDYLRRHYKMCDTVTTQQSYVKARSRQWRIEARKVAVRWFAPIYEEFSTYLPAMSDIDKKVASFVEEYEIENTGSIIDKELEAFVRVGRPVPLSPHEVPYNWHERVWQMPDGSWAVEAYDPDARQYKAERAEERRRNEILRQL